MDYKRECIKIKDKDTVAVALKELKKGSIQIIDNMEIELLEDIHFGHKFAIKDIKKYDDIIKYGESIGHAAIDIQIGSHVHTHNLKTNLNDIISYKYNKTNFDFIKKDAKKAPHFEGYVRDNGKVGVRNDIWIVPTVGCINMTAKNLAKLAKDKYEGLVDDIVPITHNNGCSQLGDDLEKTQKTLAGIINNPNSGGVLVLSLGCENNYLEVFEPYLGEINEDRVKFLVIQEVEDEYEKAMELIGELVEYASGFKRESVGLDKLTVGFKCGGSDAFSGITANVLCGMVNDEIVSYNGGTLITEVPEMFGAEKLLMGKAINEEVFNDIVNLINGYKNYFKKYNETIYENPSPGNKKGGISTLEDKSLGCIQKGGTSPVVGVLDFGDSITNSGFHLLNGPGNDEVSCTNLIASGATIIVFTTGRGNPFGTPVPTIKVASNSKLYNCKKHWIDFNAGEILDGMAFEEAKDKFMKELIEIASGTVKTKNEEYGFKEISIFRDGVIL